MAMGIGGVIGQALLGGLQGAGNAAAYVGKSQYDSEMADKQAAADFQRKKDLLALQDEMAGARYQANATFDTSEGLERMKRDQQFKVDNNDTNVGMAVKNNSTLAAGAASDVSANQPMLTDAKFQEAKTMQPLRMDEINAQGDKAIRVAQATAGPHNIMAQIAQAREGRINEASGLITNAMNALEDANTPEEKKAAQKDLIRAQRSFAIVNGKSPGNMGNESGELLKQASELDKQIKDSRESALMLPADKRKAAMDVVDRMVQQRTNIMAEAMGSGGVQSGAPSLDSLYGSASPKLPAKDPNIKGNPLGSSPPQTQTQAQSISPASSSPADVPADLQAIKSQFDKEATKLKQLDTNQSGAVSKALLSANNAARSAQQQIVDDLKVKLNSASEKLGSYPFGRF